MPAAKPLTFTANSRKARVLHIIVCHDKFTSEAPYSEPDVYAEIGEGPRVCSELKFLTDQGLLKRAGLRRHYTYRSTARGKKASERLAKIA